MLKANISKKNAHQMIEANGSIPELMNDIAVLLTAINTQLGAASPAAASLFRKGVENMIRDPGGTVWRAGSGQAGIIFKKPEEE